MGRWCTLIGVLVSIGTAYLVMQFLSIMDYVQALVQFLYRAAVWDGRAGNVVETRHAGRRDFGACWPVPLSSIGMWAWVKVDPSALRYIALSPCAKDMAENMYRALWSWVICVIVTVMVSMVTRPKPEKRTGGLGVWRDGDTVGRRPAVLSPAHFLGGRSRCRVYSREPHFLVRDKQCMRHGLISIWFFIGISADGLWRVDYGRRAL